MKVDSEEQKRLELIERLNKREVPLSYSSLKNFTSPNNFLKHKLKKYTPNAGMKFGSIGDCLLLTPEEFEKQFEVTSSVPTTDLQVNYAELAIEMLKEAGGKQFEVTDEFIEALYINSDYKGKVETQAEKTYRSLEVYIEAVLRGKTVVGHEDYEEAKTLIANLLTFEDVAGLMEAKTGAQVKIQFERMGWKFRGFLDFTLPNTIWDLKYNQSADPDEFIRQIVNYGYDFQAGVYTVGTMEMNMFEYEPNYAFLVYDKLGDYSIIEMDYSFIRYGQRKFDYRLEQLNKCVDTNSWNQSYNFFNRKVTAYKPKWAKGFELTTDKEEEL